MTKQVIDGSDVKTQEVKEWFASLPPEQQQFAFELWKMIRETDHDHVIEVKKLGERLRATLIYLLRPRSYKSPRGFVPRGKCKWN